MAQASKALNENINQQIGNVRLPFLSYLHVILPLLGAALMVTARIKGGANAVPVDGSLITLAVLCYIIAAAALITNFWAPVKFLQKVGLWTASLGFFFNLSSWLIRWVAAGDRENWERMIDNDKVYHFWNFFSYIPFANLYDLSVAFAFGAGFASLLVMNRESTRFVGAVSLPLISLVLLMAIFIGNSFIDLPPVLDSYWRPIHVGVASLSYGVALVSFALATVYLIKDGLKSEAMAAAIGVFFIVGYIVVWSMGGVKAFNPLNMTFSLNPVLIHEKGVQTIMARVAIPGLGIVYAIGLFTLIATAVCFIIYLTKENHIAKKIGHILLRVSLVVQGLAILFLFYSIKTLTGVGTRISEDQAYLIGKGLFGSEASRQPMEALIQAGLSFLAQSSNQLVLNIQGNPIEIASMVAMFTATLFVLLFGYKTEKLRENLPSLERLDAMIYKTVGVAFAGLAVLLVTGAVWANESWGRYWGWDSKETGALVAWLSYAGYLHTRIAHSWSGRRSAYFALIGFLLVIFTYLGVSYILPGLHSYA